jgi:hypothetical protein
MDETLHEKRIIARARPGAVLLTCPQDWRYHLAGGYHTHAYYYTEASIADSIDGGF